MLEGVTKSTFYIQSWVLGEQRGPNTRPREARDRNREKETVTAASLLCEPTANKRYMDICLILHYVPKA